MSFSKKYWAIHSRISLTFHASRKNKRTAYDLWQKKGSFRNSPYTIQQKFDISNVPAIYQRKEWLLIGSYKRAEWQPQRFVYRLSPFPLPIFLLTFFLKREPVHRLEFIMQIGRLQEEFFDSGPYLPDSRLESDISRIIAKVAISCRLNFTTIKFQMFCVV